MRRRVDVRSCIGNHLDPSDLKLRLAAVTLAGIRAREMVGNHRGREARVGDHPVLDGMVEIDELHRDWVRQDIVPVFRSTWLTRTAPKRATLTNPSPAGYASSPSLPRSLSSSSSSSTSPV